MSDSPAEQAAMISWAEPENQERRERENQIRKMFFSSKIIRATGGVGVNPGALQNNK
jgi:hypothetical protein